MYLTQGRHCHFIHPRFVNYSYCLPIEFKIMKVEMIEDYLNLDHGLELYPGINKYHRGNENGILYFAEYLILKDLTCTPITDFDRNTFETIMNGLEVVPGLYDRGASDKFRESPKRKISHDNISAIVAISNLLGTHHAAEIASYGVKHFGIFNNNQKGFDLPMNPGNYSPWLALANKFTFLQLLFLPFFIINYMITMSKKKEDTSSKLLYLVELYPLRNQRFFKHVYSDYRKKISRQYGSVITSGFSEIFEIYFKDRNHPINVLARRI